MNEEDLILSDEILEVSKKLKILVNCMNYRRGLIEYTPSSFMKKLKEDLEDHLDEGDLDLLISFLQKVKQ